MAYKGSLNDKYYSAPANGTAVEEMKKGIGYSPSAPVTNNTKANETVWQNNYNYGGKNTSGVAGARTTDSSATTGKTSGSGSSAYTSLLSAYLNQAQNNAQAQLAAQRAAAQSAYDKSMSALDSAYGSQLNNLRSNYDSTVNQLNASYDNSANKINTNAANSLREAYINKMLSQKNLQQGLAAQGLTGGASESAMLSLLNNYGNSRNNIETTKASNLSDLAYTLNNNLASALQEYNSAVANADTTRASQIMNLENALANNQVNAISDYYSMLNNNNDNYTSLLKSLISNMKNVSITPTEATNLVKMVNTTQASDDSESNYAKLLEALSNGSATAGNTTTTSGADTNANAQMLMKFLAQYV